MNNVCVIICFLVGVLIFSLIRSHCSCDVTEGYCCDPSPPEPDCFGPLDKFIGHNTRWKSYNGWDGNTDHSCDATLQSDDPGEKCYDPCLRYKGTAKECSQYKFSMNGIINDKNTYIYDKYMSCGLPVGSTNGKCTSNNASDTKCPVPYHVGVCGTLKKCSDGMVQDKAKKNLLCAGANCVTELDSPTCCSLPHTKKLNEVCNYDTDCATMSSGWTAKCIVAKGNDFKDLPNNGGIKRCMPMADDICPEGDDQTPHCVWAMGQEIPISLNPFGDNHWEKSGKQCDYYWDTSSDNWTQGYITRPTTGSWSCRKYSGGADETCSKTRPGAGRGQGGISGGKCGPVYDLSQNNCKGKVGSPPKNGNSISHEDEPKNTTIDVSNGMGYKETAEVWHDNGQGRWKLDMPFPVGFNIKTGAQTYDQCPDY